MFQNILQAAVLLGFVTIILGDKDCKKIPTIDHLKCCDEPKWLNAETKCNDTKKDDCYTECIVKEANLAPNEEINQANLKALFDAELKNDPDYIPVMMKSFEMCYKLGKEKLAKTEKKDSECSPLASMVILCSHQQGFANCPSAKWRTSPECEAAKQYYLDCPLLNF